MKLTVLMRAELLIKTLPRLYETTPPGGKQKQGFPFLV